MGGGVDELLSGPSRSVTLRNKNIKRKLVGLEVVGFGGFPSVFRMGSDFKLRYRGLGAACGQNLGEDGVLD